VYADVAGDSRILENFCTSMQRDRQLREFAEALIDRKRTLFGDDDRLIGEYALFNKGGEIRLRAEARDPLSRDRSISGTPKRKAVKRRERKKR
jgi:hypothetical protein